MLPWCHGPCQPFRHTHAPVARLGRLTGRAAEVVAGAAAEQPAAAAAAGQATVLHSTAEFQAGAAPVPGTQFTAAC